MTVRFILRFDGERLLPFSFRSYEPSTRWIVTITFQSGLSHIVSSLKNFYPITCSDSILLLRHCVQHLQNISIRPCQRDCGISKVCTQHHLPYLTWIRLSYSPSCLLLSHAVYCLCLRYNDALPLEFGLPTISTYIVTFICTVRYPQVSLFRCADSSAVSRPYRRCMVYHRGHK